MVCENIQTWIRIYAVMAFKEYFLAKSRTWSSMVDVRWTSVMTIDDRALFFFLQKHHQGTYRNNTAYTIMHVKIFESTITITVPFKPNRELPCWGACSPIISSICDYQDRRTRTLFFVVVGTYILHTFTWLDYINLISTY